MEFIVANAQKIDLGYLQNYNSLDIDNDTLELITIESPYDLGFFIYSPGTEYGGIIERRSTLTSEKEIKWYGPTFRGLLDQIVILPTGDYLTLSGDVNTIIQTLIGTKLGGLFKVEPACGITVSNYKFARHITALEAITNMLMTKKMRISIKVEEGSTGKVFIVKIGAVPIVDHSNDIEFSQDGKINFSTDVESVGINHLICLGKGELSARTVRHLYVTEKGEIKEGAANQYYKGLLERQAVYDYSSAETVTELLKYGTERLKELQPKQTMKILNTNIDIPIGDIVGGRDRVTGLSLKKPVLSKILRCQNGRQDLEIKVEGEE
ncbi:MAG: hypothetical protein ACRCUS_06870 [Anaerovoracaceae bacterium]